MDTFQIMTFNIRYGQADDGPQTCGETAFKKEAYRLPTFEVVLNAPQNVPLDGQFSVSVTVTNRAGGQVFDRLDDGAGFEVVQSEPHRGYLALEPTIVHFFHGTGF